MAASMAGAIALGAQSGWASFTFDVRFADGTKAKPAAGPGTYGIDIYAVVSGANLDHSDEAIRYAYLVLQSQQINGGAILGALSDGSPVSPYNDINSSRTGAGGDLNGDGVGDWGSTASNVTDSGYMTARSNAIIWGGGAVGQAVNPNTWEFKIANYDLNVTSVLASANGGTRFAVVKPNATKNGLLTANYTTYYSDSTTTPLTYYANSDLTGVYGSYVELFSGSEPTPVPEPGAAGLALGAAGLLLALRRPH